MLRLLESYFEMPKVIAVKVLTIYKEYLDHTKRVSRVFEDARTLLGHDKIELRWASAIACLLTGACAMCKSGNKRQVTRCGMEQLAARLVP